VYYKHNNIDILPVTQTTPNTTNTHIQSTVNQQNKTMHFEG